MELLPPGVFFAGLEVSLPMASLESLSPAAAASAAWASASELPVADSDAPAALASSSAPSWAFSSVCVEVAAEAAEVPP